MGIIMKKYSLFVCIFGLPCINSVNGMEIDMSLKQIQEEFPIFFFYNKGSKEVVLWVTDNNESHVVWEKEINSNVRWELEKSYVVTLPPNGTISVLAKKEQLPILL